MAHTNFSLVDKAIEIAKAYARSGNSTASIDTVLKEVYQALKEINEELE